MQFAKYNSSHTLDDYYYNKEVHFNPQYYNELQVIVIK